VEPKALSPAELRDLVKKYGTSFEVAKVIGASEAFVRQNAKRQIKSASDVDCSNFDVVRICSGLLN
jgi:hypothetical protein